MTRFLNIRAVRTRYGNVATRTIDRWVQAGVLPPPQYIQKQRYWPEEKLDECDKARQAKARIAPTICNDLLRLTPVSTR